MGPEMRKPTKAELHAVASLKAFAENALRDREAWQAVWDVAMDKGFYDPETRIVWFALLNSTTHERRLIPCGMKGEITGEELRFRYGLGPQPAPEDETRLVVEYRKAIGRAKIADNVAAEIAKMVPQFEGILAELKRAAEDIKLAQTPNS